MMPVEGYTASGFTFGSTVLVPPRKDLLRRSERRLCGRTGLRVRPLGHPQAPTRRSRLRHDSVHRQHGTLSCKFLPPGHFSCPKSTITCFQAGALGMAARMMVPERNGVAEKNEENQEMADLEKEMPGTHSPIGQGMPLNLVRTVEACSSFCSAVALGLAVSKGCGVSCRAKWRCSCATSCRRRRTKRRIRRTPPYLAAIAGRRSSRRRSLVSYGSCGAPLLLTLFRAPGRAQSTSRAVASYAGGTSGTGRWHFCACLLHVVVSGASFVSLFYPFVAAVRETRHGITRKTARLQDQLFAGDDFWGFMPFLLDISHAFSRISPTLQLMCKPERPQSILSTPFLNLY